MKNKFSKILFLSVLILAFGTSGLFNNKAQAVCDPNPPDPGSPPIISSFVLSSNTMISSGTITATGVFYKGGQCVGSGGSGVVFTGIPEISIINGSGVSIGDFLLNSLGTNYSCQAQPGPGPCTFTADISTAYIPGLSSGNYTVLFQVNNDAPSGHVETSPRPAFTVVPPLTGSCSASPNPQNINQNVTWTATASGGIAPYTYNWVATGVDGFSASGNNIPKSYSTSGTKYGEVVISSGSQSTYQSFVPPDCSVFIQASVSHDLTVAKNGNGAGSVTGVSSNPVQANISCGSACVQSYTSGTNVTLTADPSPGSSITNWSGGGCSGTGTSCTINNLSVDTTVTVTFTVTPPPSGGPYTVNTSVVPIGSGTISPISRTVNANSTGSFIVSPANSNYTISSVTDSAGCSGGSGTTNHTTGPVTANCTVTANFSTTNTSTPTVTLAASPTSMTAPANSTTLSWSATNNPTSCMASSSPVVFDWSGSKSVSGPQSISGLAPGTYIFTLTCANAGGSGAPASVTVGVSGTSMSGALTGPASCTILSGSNSCNASLSWGITSPVGVPTAITFSVGSYTVSNSLASPQSGTQFVSVPYNNKTFYLYNNAVQLAWTAVTSSCEDGTDWNTTSQTCEPPSSPINGVCSANNHYNCISPAASTNNVSNTNDWTWTCPGSSGGTNASCSETKAPGPNGTLSGLDCSIALNESTCTTTLTLDITNPVPGAETNITKAGGVVVANNMTPASKPNIVVNSPSTTFFLNHDGNTLNSKTIYATCSSGIWNGTICASSVPVNDATCTSITTPSSVVAGQTFSASAVMKNTGSKTWNNDPTYPYRLGTQSPQDTTRWAPLPSGHVNRIVLPSSTVNTNSSATFSFTATAPTTLGAYDFDWRMVEENQEWFGETCTKSINVTAAPPFPDLVASIPVPSPFPVFVNVPTTFSSIISNIGTASTGGSFPVILQRSPAKDGEGIPITTLLSQTMGTLTASGTPGDSATFTSVAYNFPNIQWYSVRVCADKSTANDVNGVINEGTAGGENNNCSPWLNVDVKAVASMSGTLSGPGCQIALNANTCTTTLTWNVNSPENVGGSAVTSNTNNSGASASVTIAPPVSTGTTDSGTKTSVIIPYLNLGIHTGRTFFLYNNAKLITQIGVTADCVSGTGWNGTICATNAVPTVTSPTATNITSTSATLGANVTSLGVPNSVSARGTCYGPNLNPAIGQPLVSCLAEGGTTTGVFTHSRTGLSSSTLYHYRGYATNSTGTGYTTDATFTTLGAAGPNLIASAPTQNTAVIGVAKTFSSTISNIGTSSTIVSFKNKFQTSASSDGSNPTEYIVSPDMSALGGGGSSATISQSITFPTGTPSTMYVRACADMPPPSPGAIAESDELDNCSSGWVNVTVSEASGPNLTASAVTPTTATAGVAQPYTATITNIGTVRAGIPGVGFPYFFQTSTDPLDDEKTKDLTPGSMSALNPSASATATSPSVKLNLGTNYVRVCADKTNRNTTTSTDSVNETDEGDNCGPWTLVTVCAPGDPCTSLYPILSVGDIDLSNYVIASLQKDSKISRVKRMEASAINVLGKFISTAYASGAVTGLPLRMTTPITNSGAGTPVEFTGKYFVDLNINIVGGDNGLTQPVPGPSEDTGWEYTPTTKTNGIGQGAIVNASADIPEGLPQGTHGIIFCADWNGDVSDPESPTSDPIQNKLSRCTNKITSYVDFPVSGPDLTAGTPTPTSAEVGTVIFSSVITNSGTVATGAGFNNLFQISASSNGSSPTDYVVNVASSLPSTSGSNTITITKSLPLSAGTYYMRVCADNNASFVGTVTESSENNNCSSGVPWTTVTIYPSCSLNQGNPCDPLPLNSCGQGDPNATLGCDGVTCSSTPPPESSCPVVGCGNGIVESGEECDYGADNGDASPSGCSSTSCTFNTWDGGTCAPTHYNCTAGTSVGGSSGASKWTWSCGGASCLEFKKKPIFIEN